MRWATVATPDGSGVALGVGNGADAVLHVVRGVTALLELLRDDGEAMQRAAESALADPAAVIPVSEARLLAPVPVPPSVRDFMAFEEHVVNASRRAGGEIDPDWYELPVFYFTNPAAVVPPVADVAVPPGCGQFDYELEIGAVVRRGGSDLEPDAAEQLIAGYTIFCDWSARDLQAREMKQRLGPAKGKDSATSMGPYLVTPDELADRRSGSGYELAMTVRVNGREYSRGTWADVYWSFPQLLSYASRGTTLVPGDVFGSGTVGRGCLLELSALHGADAYPWLTAGDQVVLEVERLGAVTGRIVSGSGDPAPLR